MIGRDELLAGQRAEDAGDFIEAAAAYRAALSSTDGAIVADAEFHLGRVAWRQGQLALARDAFIRSRDLALQAGDAEIRARAENGLGLVHYGLGEYVQARAALTVARDLSQDPVMRAKALLNLGIIANVESDFETAQLNYTRARAVFQQADDAVGESQALHNLGMLHADLGNWDDADDAFRQCLQLCEARGDRGMIATVLVNRAEVSCARGRFDDAVAGCDHAISITEETGAEVQRGEALRWKGYALARAGRAQAAEDASREAMRIGRRTHVKRLEAESTRDLGMLAIGRGDVPRAQKWLTRALELFDELGVARDADDIRQELAKLGA